MSKNLLVYYSMDGNTRFLAAEIARNIPCDSVEIEPLNPLDRLGFLKYPVGGFMAIFQSTQDIKQITQKVDDYDTILVGSPVWAGNVTPAVRTFLVRNPFRGKNVVIFGSYADSPGSCGKQMANLMNGNKVLAEHFWKKPLENREKIATKMPQWLNAGELAGYFTPNATPQEEPPEETVQEPEKGPDAF
ncbi:MAG TPA: flavodoxin [Thermotogota bacterium]|nr:flavodoxin [Thermotogota bacterium]